MNANEAILIVAIIVLIFVIVDARKQSSAAGDVADLASDAAGLGETIASKAEGLSAGRAYALLEDKTKNPEKYAQLEQLEGFSVCKDTDEVNRTLDCVCGDNPSTPFAEYDYGAPGVDYKSFVTSQAVDASVIHNHLQFVTGPNGAYSTGRTYSPDSHESYDPIPWIGLRRPEYVAQCNPTQVPDVDLNLYKRNRQFCFQT